MQVAVITHELFGAFTAQPTNTVLTAHLALVHDARNFRRYHHAVHRGLVLLDLHRLMLLLIADVFLLQVQSRLQLIAARSVAVAIVGGRTRRHRAGSTTAASNQVLRMLAGR